MTRRAFRPSGAISRSKETNWRISLSDTFVICASVAGFIYFTFPARRIAREQPVRGIKRHRRFMIAVQKRFDFSQILRSVLRSYYPCGVEFRTRQPPPPAVTTKAGRTINLLN